MKHIAISQRVDFNQSRSESRDALDQKLNAFLIECGCLTFPVPNLSQRTLVMEWLGVICPDAIVLSGGNDIGEYPSRDLTELAMLDFAVERKLPLLGICRGMQMIAHWAGVGLKQVTGHVRTRHVLRGKIREQVNSYHRYSLLHCPDHFEVEAYSEDGEIEVIRHVTLRWEGWMWHPERETKFSKWDVGRLKGLFDV